MNKKILVSGFGLALAAFAMGGFAFAEDASSNAASGQTVQVEGQEKLERKAKKAPKAQDKVNGKVQARGADKKQGGTDGAKADKAKDERKGGHKGDGKFRKQKPDCECCSGNGGEKRGPKADRAKGKQGGSFEEKKFGKKPEGKKDGADNAKPGDGKAKPRKDFSGKRPERPGHDVPEEADAESESVAQ